MRVGTLPAQALKTVAQGIAALLVLQTLRLDLIARDRVENVGVRAAP